MRVSFQGGPRQAQITAVLSVEQYRPTRAPSALTVGRGQLGAYLAAVQEGRRGTPLIDRLSFALDTECLEYIAVIATRWLFVCADQLALPPRIGRVPLNPTKFAQARNPTSYSAFDFGRTTPNAMRQQSERGYGQNISLGSGILLFGFSGQCTGKLRSI